MRTKKNEWMGKVSGLVPSVQLYDGEDINLILYPLQPSHCGLAGKLKIKSPSSVDTENLQFSFKAEKNIVCVVMQEYLKIAFQSESYCLRKTHPWNLKVKVFKATMSCPNCYQSSYKKFFADLVVPIEYKRFSTWVCLHSFIVGDEGRLVGGGWWLRWWGGRYVMGLIMQKLIFNT